MGMTFRYRALLFFAFIRRHFRKDRVPRTNESQRMAYKIARKLVSDPESDVQIAPISDQYYLSNSNVVVKIHSSYLEIINGKYFYHISMPDDEIQRLMDMVRLTLESRKENFERMIQEKTKRSLKTILEEIEKANTDRQI